MDLHEVIRHRAMVRSFSADPIDPAVIDAIVRAALRAPSAGNTGGTSWIILEGSPQTSLYWDAVTDETWRATSARSDGLRRAPVILLAYASAAAYVARYAEADKAGAAPSRAAGGRSGGEAGPAPSTPARAGDGASPELGHQADEWPVPFWIGDAAFAVMTVLLCAVDAGIGACVLGNFRGEAELARVLAVPEEWRLFCAVPLGFPDGHDHRSRSLDRAKPDPGERIHRGTW